MKTIEVTLNEKRNVRLTAFIQDVGKEYRNITKRPGVLVIPGGGYMFCSDREAEPVALAYLNAGYDAFILRYTINEVGSWPDPLQDYEDAMEYFTEYFQETDEEGAEELMKELGTPKEAARELMANLLNKKIEDHQNYETDGQTRAEQKGSGKHVVWIALLVLFAAPVGAPLLAAFAAVVLALVVCVFVILLCVVLCLMLIGGKILIRGILAVPFSMSGFAMLTGSGLLAVGAGILGVLLCVYLCKWSSMLIAKLVRRITGRKRERLER